MIKLNIINFRIKLKQNYIFQPYYFFSNHLVFLIQNLLVKTKK